MIHQTALSHFGIKNQEDKLIEEMSELTQALIKNRQFRDSNVPEEIADVQIVLNQLKIAYPEWITWEQMKLKRLEEKLGESR